MRNYQTNSPQAAARIVALALVADGHASKAEFDVLERIGACEQLGVGRDAMHAVLQCLCEDLLLARRWHWGDAGQIEPGMLNQLMAEVDDPALRNVVLQICVAIVEADGHVADGESIVLVNAVEQWGLHHQMLGAAALRRCDSH
jgi:uncharacterized tellurite resistance protein B-like protein